MKRKGKFIPVMLTPFHEDGSIDYPTLARLTSYYIEAGATGLFANCLSSEMFELTEQERIDITKFVVKEVAGLVPVFSTGTFAGSLQHKADFTKRIYETGVTGVVAITSLLAKQDESENILLDRIHQFLTLTEQVPLGFYECPVPYKRVLSASGLGSIVSSGRVIYYKDTSLDINSIKEKINLTAGYNGFELYDAYMANAVASLKEGCAGLSCIQGNYIPELISWIAENYNSVPNAEKIEIAQKFLVDSMDVMHDIYPFSAKYFLQLRNIPIQLYTRRDVGTLSAEAKKRTEQLLTDYENLQEVLGIKTIIA